MTTKRQQKRDQRRRDKEARQRRRQEAEYERRPRYFTVVDRPAWPGLPPGTPRRPTLGSALAAAVVLSVAKIVGEDA